MHKEPQWPADAVERRPVASLVPYARNARTHSEEQVAQIAASIREWGWTVPVLVDEESGLIAGHGRVLAAQKLGLADVPVMVARGWSDAQKRAYILADNKLAMNAGWDADLLRVELDGLKEEGFDVSLTGFGEDELSDLLANAGDADLNGAGSLGNQFGIPPFSVLNAREGWWQDRKRAWLALGIKSELGRGAAPGGAPMPMDRDGGGKPGRSPNAAPGGSALPAADYSKRQRGNGRGQAIG